jgi:hypothetical protein
MPAHGTMTTAPTIFVVYSADETTANLYTKAGSPAGVVTVVCTINAGVKLSSTSTATPALIAPANFAAGSTWRLVNLGKTYGAAGDGGNGGNVPNGAGQNGRSGGNAIESYIPVQIENASGEIFAGGAGGKGGGAGSTNNGPGGGGGQGAGVGQGGNHGTGGIASSADGHNGGESGPGTAGTDTGDAHPGASGKTWGGFGTGTGAQAFALKLLGGATVTWISGNDVTHVKGAVT